jgi:hypothetical protein
LACEQARKRPELIGWFVGQAMRKLEGRADPDDVYAKASHVIGFTERKTIQLELREAVARLDSMVMHDDEGNGTAARPNRYGEYSAQLRVVGGMFKDLVALEG